MESSRFLFDPSLSSGSMLFLGSGDDTLLPGGGSAMGTGESLKRRALFSLPEELYEYYDEQMPEKKRRLTIEQVHLLEKSFEEENKLEPDRKTELAKKLGLQPRQVAVWFQNRRARWKTKQLERDYDILKSSYDSLLLNYDSISKENEQLRSQLISLNEKLQAREVTGGDPKAQKQETAIQLSGKKITDRPSSGSGRSSPVEEEGMQLIVSSGDSNFEYCRFMTPFDGIQSEDDRSEDGQSYFRNDVFVAAAVAASQHLEEEEPMCWWEWSKEFDVNLNGPVN
ncbi:hypothetical protein SAY87_002808 [Trapa incisa]|uniref:Homeobox-leucine zipper protein n=1 Tax=Trapa incisa TaxID=236973 RepID=A0AAN7JVU4_9MYRT|nr:hypothetical protein SAY87_002808 [Trapa incisa]